MLKRRVIALLTAVVLACAGVGDITVFADGTDESLYRLKVSADDQMIEVGEEFALDVNLLQKFTDEEGDVSELAVSGVTFEYKWNEEEFEQTGEHSFRRLTPDESSIRVIAKLNKSTGETITAAEYLYEIDKVGYDISFKKLRGKNTTWVFHDEESYSLELDVDHFENQDNTEIEWALGVENKEGAFEPLMQSESFMTIAQDQLSAEIDGTSLAEEGLLETSLIVKAEVKADGVKTLGSESVKLEVKESQYSFIENDKIRNADPGDKWNYAGDAFPIYIQNEDYPEGEILNVSIDNIVIADEKILTAMYNELENIWELAALKEGTTQIQIYVQDEDKQYIIDETIEIVCEHKVLKSEKDVSNIVAQMQQWLGFNEKNKTHRAIIDVYNSHKPLAIGYKVKYTDSWCAATVSAAAIVCGLTDVLPTECGCERMINLLIDIGAWQEDESVKPAPGWIIFYDWQDDGKGDNKGWSDHVGIVEKVSGSKITVIEGNYDDSVKRRTISVNAKNIRGYGVPQYGIERVRATTSKSGKLMEVCAGCGETMKTTVIPSIKSISLSTQNYTYDGKVKKPSVKVKNSKGDYLKEGRDYTVSYDSGRKIVWKYDVKVTFKNNYSGKNTLTFSINPSAPKTVIAKLYGGHDDVKVSWSKSEGADGYYVYYKRSDASSYKKLCATTKRYCTVANLSDGYKYTFKIVPYYDYKGEKVLSHRSATDSVYTLVKMDEPTISKYSSSKVKVKYTGIDGASGYQISKSSLKLGRNIVATTTSKSKTLTVTKNKTYYYKVRAYKTVDGKKIYGPWSEVKSYKLK